MPFKPISLIPVVASFALALILTPVVRRLAHRWKFVAKPKTDRWHKKPTAMLGGVAIFLSVAIVIVVYLLFVPPRPDEILNHDRDSLWVVLGASAFLFAVVIVVYLLFVPPRPDEILNHDRDY